jgi:hypothetical protein
MVGLGPTIHEFPVSGLRSLQANSWMVVPSTTMTKEKERRHPTSNLMPWARGRLSE